jgi:hypothetical protein
MKWYILLLLFVVSAYSSIVKQEPVSPVVPEFSPYNDNGNLDLLKLVSVKEGQTIGLKAQNNLFVGVVQQIIKDKETLNIIGKFLNPNHGEFVFSFERLSNKETHVVGVLLFKNLNKLYSLELNKETKQLEFQEKQINSTDDDKVVN